MLNKWLGYQVDNPGIISITLAVITLILVSLFTQKDNS
jgi:Na+(H+)/acetate symporter ActP